MKLSLSAAFVVYSQLPFGRTLPKYTTCYHKSICTEQFFAARA